MCAALGWQLFYQVQFLTQFQFSVIFSIFFTGIGRFLQNADLLSFSRHLQWRAPTEFFVNVFFQCVNIWHVGVFERVWSRSAALYSGCSAFQEFISFISTLGRKQGWENNIWSFSRVPSHIRRWVTDWPKVTPRLLRHLTEPNQTPKIGNHPKYYLRIIITRVLLLVRNWVELYWE